MSRRWRTRESVEDNKGGEGSVQGGAAAHRQCVGPLATARRRESGSNLHNAIDDGLWLGAKDGTGDSIARLLSGRRIVVWLLGCEGPRGRARHFARHYQLPSACSSSECLGQHVGEAASEGLVTGIYFPRDAA